MAKKSTVDVFADVRREVPRVYSRWDPPFHPGASLREYSPEEDDRTKQSFKEECSIEYILSRVARGQDLGHLIRSGAIEGDFSSVPDYHQAMNVVARANEQFGELDAKVRRRFHNDPAEFLQFVSDPENHAEMVKFGLAKYREVPSSSAPAEAPRVPGGPAASTSAAPEGGTSRAGEK